VKHSSNLLTELVARFLCGIRASCCWQTVMMGQHLMLNWLQWMQAWCGRPLTACCRLFRVSEKGFVCELKNLKL